MALSAMMRQYLDIKAKYPDALLLFRLGDFYEMFFDDAETASRELELTLTGRDCGLEKRAPMCGVPYHALDTYLARLIAKGYKAAICEQMTDPAESNGLVERQVTRVVTPGTIVEANMLDEHKPNYVMAVALSAKKAGAAFCDVSTGEFFLYEFPGGRDSLADELARVAPSELLAADEGELGATAKARGIAVTIMSADKFSYASAARSLAAQFKAHSLAELGVSDIRQAVCAAGALLEYLKETQLSALKHIISLTRYYSEAALTLDSSARASLELTESLRGKNRKGTLLWLLDETVTAMGSRMLREWIERPLRSREDIEARLDACEELKDNPFMLDGLREALSPVRDVERLLSKIAYDTVNARDCLALLASLKALPPLRAQLEGARGEALAGIRERIAPFDELANLLEAAIHPDAPLSVKDGGIIRPGYNRELDELRAASTEGKEWLAELEAREREATGIKNLKVGYNRVFGYYIEVTKSYYANIPQRYIRKQTLAACERFITDELKELENKVLGAEDKAQRFEYRLFSAIREKLSAAIERLSRIARSLKALDALASLARVAAENGYVRPTINSDGAYEIIGGRHPVVEKSIGRNVFVPNDTCLTSEDRVMIITGPNMAGKSTYMRQVALIVVMAHIGSFVPAESANIALTDRVFTRVGASDDLFAGKSTFMVEMSELATILKNATPQSLVILDEIGRGTSTFDGLSIAWAAVEYIANAKKCGARTLFATHYHELSELEGKLPGIVNYRITAREVGSEVVFLRQIVKGGADKSFGVAVAALAGLPQPLINRAHQIMARLEVSDETQGGIGQRILDNKKNAGNRQIGMSDFEPMQLIEELRALDVTAISPIEALNKLYLLAEKARHI